MSTTHGHDRLLVALAGQPNVGKSTIFNQLTGASQRVANFPGVTVERQEGRYTHEKSTYELVDLPGTYSLTSYTQEERVARDFLLLENPEVLLVVLDASNLERNFYLAFQCLEIESPVVVCLSMMDVAEARGFKIDTIALEKELGVPVVGVAARNGRGIAELRHRIHEVAQGHTHSRTAWQLDYGRVLEPSLKKIEGYLTPFTHLCEDFPPRWLAVKLMENDPEAVRIVRHHAHGKTAEADAALAAIDAEIESFRTQHDDSPIKIIAGQRFERANAVMLECVDSQDVPPRTTSDKIDDMVLHPVGAWFALGVILFIFYWITMHLGAMANDGFVPYLEMVRGWISHIMPISESLIKPSILRSLLLDGVLEGVISLLGFAPLFLILFALIAILEDTGYLARVAFLMDPMLRRFGLHGQSTLPLLLGGAVSGGCAVPGVIATRSMRDQRARMATILVMPLLNCVGKIPVYALVIAAFFPTLVTYQALTMTAMTGLSLLMALLVARVLTGRVVKGEEDPFLLELPPYHLPRPLTVLRVAGRRLWLFIRKVVTVVAAMQVLVWASTALPALPEKDAVVFATQLDNAKEKMYTAMGPQYQESSEAKLLHGAYLLAAVDFAERYDTAMDEAGDDAEAREAVTQEFRTENREYLAFCVKPSAYSTGVTDTAVESFADFREDLGQIRDARSRAQLEQSIAGRFGRILSIPGQYAGFNWRINVAAVTCLAARENLVGTLGTLYGVSGQHEGTLPETLRRVEKDWTIWNGFALLIFVSFLPPCLPTIVTVLNETRSWAWTAFAATYPVLLGFVFAVIVYQLGSAVAG